MIKRFCDVCRKEIKDLAETCYFDGFEVCKDCYKKLKNYIDDWKFQKRIFFTNFLDVKQNRLEAKKPAKTEALPFVHVEDIKPNACLGKPAPHTHVCKCKEKKLLSRPSPRANAKSARAVRKSNAPVPLSEIKKQLDREEARKKKFCGSSDLAKELGKCISTISHYATANNIGKLKGTVRVYNVDEADMIRKHFGR